VAAARQDIEFAKQISPYDPVVYNSFAMLSLIENKPQDAVASFEQALKVDATNFDALNGLINLYAQTQQIDRAQAAIDQALSSYPNVAQLHYLKAQAYGFQRNIQMVEAELNKALELDPGYLNAYFALGSLYINTKQEDRAIAEYQKIIARRPENVVPYTLIGILEDQRKNYDVAAENYRKALEKDPNAIIAANNLAWLYAVTGKGNLDEALRLAQSVVQKKPNTAGFIDTLGWVYYKKNLHGPAVEQLRNAVRINEAESRARNVSPSPTYHYHLGMALKGKGDREESRRELETAIRISEKVPFPDVAEAKKALSSM
jgi:tetratricopeptide (TPR) repeat protein